MRRATTTLIGGILIGVVAMHAIDRYSERGNPLPDEFVRDIGNQPKMSLDVAEKHRDEQYANLSSIEEISSLPTEFSRAEALFVLAGRSDSADIQKLVFEANRIADDEERVSMLDILFFRLAEMDPRSALALARTERIAGMKVIERTVWRTWARHDIDDALLAAKTQTTLAHRKSAAQSLYAAFGYLGNSTIERIASELNIGPDRSTRGRYLYLLADKSPATAIEFINRHDPGPEKDEYVSWLAYYLTLSDPQVALGYARLFADAEHREYYEAVVNNNMARENPRATIERILAGSGDDSSSGEMHNAVRALASTDLEAAMQLYEQAGSDRHRRMMGSAIASELARKDPVEALAWARANETGRYPYLQSSVLTHLAMTDPQLAISEAQKSPNLQLRASLVSSVVTQIAERDPSEALVYLGQLQDQRQRRDARQNLASSWLRKDPAAAVEWILASDEESDEPLIQMAVSMLADTDIDAANRLLSRLDGQARVMAQQQVAERLATSRSPADALAFIRQFDGQPGFDQLQASVISGMAQTDPIGAKQLADQLADGDARDRAYVAVIAQQAQSNPVDAVSWLNNISNENLRGVASGQVAAQWYATDPAAAVRWVANLPAGSSRDDAIMHMSSSWRVASAEQDELIATIENPEKRGQAKIQQVYRVMQSDPARARELLDDEDISDVQRQQIEMKIRQRGLRY